MRRGLGWIKSPSVSRKKNSPPIDEAKPEMFGLAETGPRRKGDTCRPGLIKRTTAFEKNVVPSPGGRRLPL